MCWDTENDLPDYIFLDIILLNIQGHKKVYGINKISHSILNSTSRFSPDVVDHEKENT